MARARAKTKNSKTVSKNNGKLRRLMNPLSCGVPHLAQFKNVFEVGKYGYRMRFVVYDDSIKEIELLATNRIFLTEKEIENKYFEGNSWNLFSGAKFKVVLMKNPKDPNKLTIKDLVRVSDEIPLQSWVKPLMERWQGCSNDSFRVSKRKKEYLQERREKNDRIDILEQLRDLQNGFIKDEFSDELYEKYSKVFGTWEDRSELIGQIEKFLKEHNLKWSDRFTKWTLVHLYPVYATNLTDLESCRKAFHVSNLKPQVREFARTVKQELQMRVNLEVLLS